MLLVPLLLLACPTPEERTEQAREDARQAVARGDRAAALRAIDTLRENTPNTPADLIEVAQLLVLAGEGPEALRALELGLERWPDADELRLALARAAILVSDASRARATLLEVGPDSEQHATALVLRAQAELRLGDFERAVATLSEAERLYPDAPEARIARIGALLKERRIDEARAALEESRPALEAAGADEPLLGFELTLLATQSADDPETAIAGLRELVDAHPDDPRAWRTLFQAMLATGAAEEAAKLLRGAIDDDPDRLYLYEPLATLYTALQRADDAVSVLREAIERSPSPSAYLALAQHFADLSASEQVLGILEEALVAFPDDALLRRADAEAKLVMAEPSVAGEAVASYRDRFPDDPNSEYLRARLDLANGNPGAAIERLTELMPELDQPYTQHWLGQALEAAGDDVGAQRRYSLAVQRDPNDPALYLPLVRLSAQRGNWRDVASLGEQVVRVAPQRYAGLIELGDAPRAEPAARRFAALFPEREDAQLAPARALRAAGRFDEALAALDEVPSGVVDPALLEAERALTLGLAGRLEEAIALAQRAVQSHPDSAAAHQTAASLLFQAGRADEGTRAVDRALELEPDDPEPLAFRARFRASVGHLEGALQDCERYLAARPDDAGMHFVLGAIHQGLGRPDAAITAYRRAAELDRTAFEPRNNLAYLLADRDLDGALAAAQEAYALRPESPAVLDTLGWLYLRKGLVDRATSLLEEAHAGAPELAEVQLHLALAHREAGRHDDARALLVALAERGDLSSELEAQARDALRSLE